MEIAIIGTGRVAAALGPRWAAAGHTLAYGSRTPDDPRVRELVARSGAGARAGGWAEAAAGADVIVLAVPARVTLETAAGLGDVAGKVVLDATNPFGQGLGGAPSGGEALQRSLPGARVVKVFNTTGTGNMERPAYDDDGVASMFLCGDDDEARALATALVREIGLEPVDCGPLAMAGPLEAMGQLWVHLAYRLGLGTDIAFRLMRR